MLDPGWTIRTPEENALIFEVAPGPAATIANGLAWSAEAANIAASVAVSAVNTVGTLAEWQGAGAVASGTSATMLNTSDTLRQSWAEAKVPIAAAAVDAFGAARSAVIPSAVSTENRTECAFDIGINPLTLWQLSPRIAELELEYYGEHWPHNTSVGLAYAAALSALTAALAVPPPLAPMAASPGAPAAAAAAVSQSAATDGASVAMRESAQAAQSATQGASQAAGAPSDMASQMSSMMQPVQSLTQMVPQALQAFPQAFQGLASMPQSMMGSLGGMFGSMKPTDAAVDAGLAQRVSAVSAAGGAGGGGAGIGGGGIGGYPGAGLTSYTRPTSSFDAEGGRPAGARSALLNPAELRGPTTTGPVGGSPMPMSPATAGMLGRGQGQDGKDSKDYITHARVVLDDAPQRN